MSVRGSEVLVSWTDAAPTRTGGPPGCPQPPVPDLVLGTGGLTGPATVGSTVRGRSRAVPTDGVTD